jgi:D-3-phosphoglycerate dehydrogenase
MSTVVFLDSVHEVLFEDLTKLGYNCVWDEKNDLNFITKHYQNIQGLVIRSRFVLDDEAIDLFPNLKWVARSGSGLENIDINYCNKKQIKVFSSPEGNAEAVGEFVLGSILSLIRKIPSGNSTVRNNLWLREEHRGIELSNQTVAIIGLGHMGKSAANKLKSIGCRVLAHDIALIESPLPHVELVSLETIFNEADIVSLHLPLTKETKGYANHLFFDSFKKPIYFINTARGQHCVTADLLNAIKNEKVLGAALDVLEFEGTNLQLEQKDNLIYNRLIQEDRVMLTPHIAGWTKESYYKLSKVLSNKITQSLVESS